MMHLEVKFYHLQKLKKLEAFLMFMICGHPSVFREELRAVSSSACTCV